MSNAVYPVAGAPGRAVSGSLPTRLAAPGGTNAPLSRKTVMPGLTFAKSLGIAAGVSGIYRTSRGSHSGISDTLKTPSFVTSSKSAPSGEVADDFDRCLVGYKVNPPAARFAGARQARFLSPHPRIGSGMV